MADVKDIAKAKLYQVGLKRLIGVSPDLDIQKDYVRVYYAPDKLIKAQEAYKRLIEAPPGKIRVDIKPVIQPYYVKKLVPLLAGSILAGYLLGGK